MTYFPSDHDVIMFGGLSATTYNQDTWTLTKHNWTEVVSNAGCTSTTCPSVRAGAMIAYYAPLHAVLLFGGFFAVLGFVAAFNDTWLFYGGAWHNVTATAGAAPAPRYLAAMSWDPLDNDVVLFGGALASGTTVDDTWVFNGTWHNVTSTVKSLSTAGYPTARAGMAISASPSGYLLMFGGESPSGTVLWDNPTSGCSPMPMVSWWFHQNAWSPMKYGGVCVQSPVPVAPTPATTQPPGYAPPCGRVDPGLGWSPKNQHFVLYGGYGPTASGTYCGSGANGWLNDTYLYQNPPGNGFDWLSVGDSGDPSNRSDVAFASDYTDGYFVIFGGDTSSGATLFNSTFRFFALVHARLTGPSTIDANTSDLSFNVPFTAVGFGGSGDLDYAFTLVGLRSTNALVDSGSSDCAILANTTGPAVRGPLPYDGVATFSCTPTAQSFNIYRLTVHIWDAQNGSDSATSNWTFTVHPPETEKILSQYTTVFYTGFAFPNIFGVYAKVNGLAANTLTGSLGSQAITFSHASTFWWNSTPINMGAVTPGTVLRVTGDWAGWTLNATYTPQMVRTPSWLASLFAYTGATQAIATSHNGPYNQSYSIYENYSWSVSSSSSFALPSPMVSGKYSLIPAIAVSFSASSSGSVSLAGSLTSQIPTIDTGPVELKFSVSIGLSGKFTVLNDTQGISDVQWASAKATISVIGDVGANVPIYGFDILGVDVGFTLVIDVKATVALTFLLAPTTDTTKEIIQGVQVMMTQLLGAFTLAMTVAVKFGIAIASVELGGTLQIALTFNITPSFRLDDGWLNGTIFAQAQFLFWTATWDILGPAVIYNWTNPPPALPGPQAPRSLTRCPTCHDNGSNATWGTQPRYYVSGTYDDLVWSGTVSTGPAVSDLYPFTSVSAASASNGGYLFYSDDNVQAPVAQGLKVSGLHLDPATNHLASIPSPVDPGFVLDQPRATALPDGSLYVVWAALPQSEASLASPSGLSTLALHGARFYPSNQTWGSIHTWSTWGLAEAYDVDGSAGNGTVVELVAPTFLVGPATPERLVTYDLISGREVANVSVSGVSSILSLRGALGDAAIERIGGNYSVLNLTTGSPITVAPPFLSGSFLIWETFVVGTASTLVLVYRNANATQTFLYDLRSGTVVANLSTDQSATTAEAVFGDGTYYLFEGLENRIAGWRVEGGSVTNLSIVAEPNLQSFGVVQSGTSLLLYALVTNGQFPQPIVTLEFAEIGTTLPRPSGGTPAATSAPSGGTSSSTYLLYLAIGAGLDALLLAGIAVARRRRGGPGRGPVTSPPEPLAPASSTAAEPKGGA